MRADMPGVRITPLGDSALLAEFGTTFAPEVNVRALAFAAGLAARHVAGIRDVVPAYASVAVHFDPLRTRVEQVEDAIRAELREPRTEPESGPVASLPCCYGGGFGPDLAGVAAWAGCSEADVIARHTAREYRVCMIGFLPGFPYLAEVDPRIAAPRHPTPRLVVQVGSVGIAGLQTGVYPVASPGGWQIIGRTPVRLFDAARTPPTRLLPGMRVRFVPLDPKEFDAAPGGEPW